MTTYYPPPPGWSRQPPCCCKEGAALLTVNLIAVGKLKEKWLRDGLAEYQKRLESHCRFTVTELDEYRLPDNPSAADIQRGLEAEGDAILRQTQKSTLIALCIEGKQLSSEALSAELQRFAQTTSRLCFVIGGSFGLCERVKQQAALRLSISPMTFPHQLFRVLLTEQLYRAFAIAAGSRYHK